jgi:hypothetical protein
MDTIPKIDDDMLSAYIDGELPPHDMQLVRTALVADALLAKRLSALKLANDLVTQHARALDEIPLRSSTLALLQTGPEDSAPLPANVVRGPWRRTTPVQRWLASSLVATLALTFAYFVRGPATEGLPALAVYAQQLDTAPSGAALVVNDATLVTRFSFRDIEDRYCRQYRLTTENAGAENIACRTPQGWTLVASMPDAASATGAAYQPASTSPELNAVLDAMMEGAALDLATEAGLIANGWPDSSD